MQSTLRLSWTFLERQETRKVRDKRAISGVLKLTGEPAQEIGQEGEDQKGKMEPKSEDHSTCAG